MYLLISWYGSCLMRNGLIFQRIIIHMLKCKNVKLQFYKGLWANLFLGLEHWLPGESAGCLATQGWWQEFRNMNACKMATCCFYTLYSCVKKNDARWILFSSLYVKLSELARLQLHINYIDLTVVSISSCNSQQNSKCISQNAKLFL